MCCIQYLGVHLIQHSHNEPHLVPGLYIYMTKAGTHYNVTCVKICVVKPVHKLAPYCQFGVEVHYAYYTDSPLKYLVSAMVLPQRSCVYTNLNSHLPLYHLYQHMSMRVYEQVHAIPVY